MVQKYILVIFNDAKVIELIMFKQRIKMLSTFYLVGRILKFQSATF